ncbi:putative PC-Esterase [Helianthus annuus]|uniref:PC-Esterase n=1 Tax=Helianthus annuus TaxID=4232 RepID=A0A9K3IRB1_HELAN|nr:putative PC-Esterase [Helianthus annuus]KAJ0565449.1 putative PC-Esterase [Helianthus annuus]KAJ0910563.1 putative PC-Esterase [Helianthus annuus]
MSCVLQEKKLSVLIIMPSKGSPDKDYENYRWKPTKCELPGIDPKKFLELMKGKTLAFIGDSVARNQMESLLCIL